MKRSYFLFASVCLLVIGTFIFLTSNPSAPSSNQISQPITNNNQVVENPGVVRVAAVNTTLSTGILQSLAKDFEQFSGMKVEFLKSATADSRKKGRGKQIFQLAKSGEADLIIAHYGKPEVEPFVKEGFGHFPRLVFANQAALIGPASDPANVKGMKDASQAMKKILDSGNTFVVNKLKGQTYLSEMLWYSAGQPDKADRFVYSKEQKAKAVADAESKNAYVLFGVQPFLHFKNKHQSKMEILAWEDPMFQRPMASIVIQPDKVRGVNAKGAEEFQSFLLSASTQAKVKSFRMNESDRQYWWPCARGNNPSELPVN